MNKYIVNKETEIIAEDMYVAIREYIMFYDKPVVCIRLTQT